MQFHDSLEKLSFQYYAVITYRMLSLMATAYTTDINMDLANYFPDKGALNKEHFTKERKNMANWKLKLIMNHRVLAAPFNPLKSEFQSKTKFVSNSM